MDKQTLLAVILSVIVISVGFYIQSEFFMPPVEDVTGEGREGAGAGQEGRTADSQSGSQSAGETGDQAAAGTDESASGGQQGSTQGEQGSAQTDTDQAGRAAEAGQGEKVELAPGASSNIEPYGENPPEQEVYVENKVFDITFSNKGAVAKSIKLKEHLSEGEPLEMVQNGSTDLGAFGITFGEPFDGYTDTTFHVRRIDDLTVEFYRDFAVPSSEGEPVPFTLSKKFIFKPNDYMMELRVSVENSVNAYPPLDFNGYAYTLGYGPEIGPEIESLDGRYSYRRFYSYADGDRNRHRFSGTEKVTDRVVWMGLLGKYFTVIGIPDATKYDMTLSDRTIEGMDFSHQLFFSRPRIKSSVNEDVFQFYIGPKLNRVLTDYNNSDRNGFGTSDLNLQAVVDTGWAFLGWLEWILKKMMMFFHSIIPNWGVAIVMLTIAIKIVLFPITHKSYESTSKMQQLNPKIQEIRSEYKDNPQKMNQEMANLYKSEGVNPLGGCLPLLLQMPIFIALYGLLNKHFDLRGATFIEGWISDLSSPESIFSFAPIQIPILGWSDIRLLPILFAATMFFSSKLMQQPGQSSQGNMKMVMYMMPFFLFFVLYNAPSGLLVYWIMTNFLTVLQQKVIAKRGREHKQAEEDGAVAAAAGPPVTGSSGGDGSKSGSDDSGKSNAAKNEKKNTQKKNQNEKKKKEPTPKNSSDKKPAKSGKPAAAKNKGKKSSNAKGGAKSKNSSAIKSAARRYSVPKSNRTKKKKKR